MLCDGACEIHIVSTFFIDISYLRNIPNLTFPFDEAKYGHVEIFESFFPLLTQVLQKIFGNAVYFYRICLKGTLLLKKLIGQYQAFILKSLIESLIQ